MDDESDIQALLTRALRQQHSVAVDSGEEALALLEIDSFELIFLDLLLAGMGGTKAGQANRSRNPTAEVVNVTGYSGT